MENKFNKFISVYDNVLDNSVCNFLISTFEKNSKKQERIENNKKPNFTQFNLTENNNCEETNNIHNFLINTVFRYKKIYYEIHDERCFPLSHGFEQFRIKKYNNDGKDCFDYHVDVIDHSSSRRFLSFLWYLNDVNDGGETVFDNLTIEPKTGRMVIFPPLWMFPHSGKPPISNTKYILSTYLHYK